MYPDKARHFIRAPRNYDATPIICLYERSHAQYGLAEFNPTPWAALSFEKIMLKLATDCLLLRSASVGYCGGNASKAESYVRIVKKLHRDCI